MIVAVSKYAVSPNSTFTLTKFQIQLTNLVCNAIVRCFTLKNYFRLSGRPLCKFSFIKMHAPLMQAPLKMAH